MSKPQPSFLVLGILQGMQFGIVVVAIWKLVTSYPTDHWAFDLRMFYMVGLATMLSSLIVLRRYQSRLALYSLALGAAFLAFMAVLDFGNILVDDDLWLERGQPAPFESAKPKTP